MNSLVGTRVTTPGVLRPTTRSPVLVHNPDDADWFGQDRILPDLAAHLDGDHRPRARSSWSRPTSLPPGLAVLDAPDIDSVEERNRTLADPAARRGGPVAVRHHGGALRRPGALGLPQAGGRPQRRRRDRARPHAAGRRRRGQQPPRPDAHRARARATRRCSPCARATSTTTGCSPPPTSPRSRSGWARSPPTPTPAPRVVKQTLEGAIRSLAAKSHQVADAAMEQVGMQAPAAARRRPGLRRRDQAPSTTASADGTLLRGEVLARWQEFVGTGELLRGLESKVSWLRDRISNAVRGKPQQAGRVTVAVESGLQTLILENAENAAERTAAAWQSMEAGRQLLDAGGQDLGRASRDFRARADRAVRDWQQGVLDLVRKEGADKRTTARFLAYGVNGLGVALMVVVFASTAGITGAEVGIAGGSAVVGQKLLEAVFGDQAVRRLAAAARKDLNQRVTALLEAERRRFVEQLDKQEISSTRARSEIRGGRAGGRRPALRPADGGARRERGLPGDGVTPEARTERVAGERAAGGCPPVAGSQVRPGGPDLRARPGGRGVPRPAGRRGRRPGCRRSCSAPAPGCGCRRSTPWSRSRVPPARASPRPSTP